MESTENKINITLPENYNGQPVEVVLREGKAADIEKKRHYSIDGVITSINEYVAKRTYSAAPAENREIVVYSVNPDDARLSIESNPNDEIGARIKISSRLKPNPELALYGINQDKYFTQKDLKKLVRKTAHLFPDIAVAQGLIRQLDNFQAKFETEVKKSDDRQGNSEDSIKSAIKFVEGMLPTSLTLKAPLYENTPEQELVLGIEIEKRGDHAEFAFYCLELEPLRRVVAEEVIMAEVEKLSPKFVCIEQ